MKYLNLITAALLAVGSMANAGDVLQEKFVFTGSELQGDFKLSHDILETVYEWREVDSTCTRQVQDGTETKCTTYYENECSQQYRCHTRYENECRQEYECRTRYERECRTEYRRECHTERRCPGRPGTNCRDEQVCNNRPYQHCENRPRQHCSYETRCHSVPRQQCGYETECHSVPKQRCEQVPKYKTETYACKKNVQVPVGTERKLLVTADITVNFSQPSPELKPNEEFLLALENDELQLRLVKDSGQALLFDKLEKTIEEGTKLKAFRAKWSIDIVGIESLLSPIKGGIQDLRVEGELLKFSVGRVLRPEFLVLGVELTRKKSLGTDPIVFDGDLTGTQVQLAEIAGNRTEVTIPLSNLAKNEPLKNSKYNIALTAKVGTLDKQPLNKASVPALTSSKQLEFKLEGR